MLFWGIGPSECSGKIDKKSTIMEQIWGVLMKKILTLFVSITSIFVLSAIIRAYFIEDILNLIKLSRTKISSIIIDPDIKILLCLGLIGIIGFFVSRAGNNWIQIYLYFNIRLWKAEIKKAAIWSKISLL
jgi:hypothetical protein